MIKPGFWRSADGNPFWVRVIGAEVFWLGMNQESSSVKSGVDWCHVGHGKIEDNKIALSWADIPAGKDELHGRITVEIVDTTHIRVVDDSGDFGRSEWKWVADRKGL